MKHFEYLEPGTVDEACGLLKQYGGNARVFAGGSSLTILLKQGFLQPDALINIKKIDELRRIEESGDDLVIGALVTHHDIETSSLLAGRLPVLCELEHDVANIRVRNMATVGGNIASGEPLTDLPCVFITLDATVRIANTSGGRTLLLEEVFVDYYETQLGEDEVLTHVVIPPLPARSAIDYVRFSSSSVVDKPCIGVAVRMSVEDETCRGVRIGLGCVAPTPMRARNAEAALEGQPLNDENLHQAARAAADECDPMDDLRGSERYKREMVAALVRRLARKVYEKARGDG
ncbi:MAG: xanthine dehydrogenase family protein subunit M [Deltaproteobacteria bacterium]|nr:xanthine dehydrogenase family protein subunit M [Deltaproteobacteria bacterium]